ncbi:P-loop containing nucleoside triphosphate hydrolase [Sesbania bispinosa]|nr:P-loop containing nucleoside triphosphate hydrolase [Sesbania bispinosa]
MAAPHSSYHRLLRAPPCAAAPSDLTGDRGSVAASDMSATFIRKKDSGRCQTQVATFQGISPLHSAYKERMATIVAEAFLSASIEVLLDKIISPKLKNFFQNKKLDVSLLEKLKTTLLSLQAVLNDVEEKQITNPTVKKWLDSLRDVVFEADDLLDEINTKALSRKVKAECQGHIASATNVRNILSSSFKQYYRMINSKMQTLFERLKHLRKQKLGLKEGVSSSVWHATPTSSVVDESAIYGRDGDINKLKDYLLSEDRDHKIGVISIVGMGSLGKTTLPKLLYNDPYVEEKFNLKAWAYI